MPGKVQYFIARCDILPSGRPFAKGLASVALPAGTHTRTLVSSVRSDVALVRIWHDDPAAWVTLEAALAGLTDVLRVSATITGAQVKQDAKAVTILTDMGVPLSAIEDDAVGTELVDAIVPYMEGEMRRANELSMIGSDYEEE